MPGPGGGGGGGRGGSFGGGGGHGGFGGGPHGGPRPHRPMMGGFWHRPFFGGFGGGCLGGMMSLILLPIFLVIVIICLVVSLVGGLTSSNYNENTFQTYANEQYYQVFADYVQKDDEDCLLIVVLVDDEEYYTYYDMVWYGYHINKNIRDQLDTANDLFSRNINATSYQYSLGNDLKEAMEELAQAVATAEYDQLYSCKREYSTEDVSGLVNRTSFLTGQADLDAAVKEFAEETGIPTVLLVEDYEEVFTPAVSGTTLLLIFLAVVLIIALIVAVVVRKRNNTATT